MSTLEKTIDLLNALPENQIEMILRESHWKNTERKGCECLNLVESPELAQFPS